MRTNPNLDLNNMKAYVNFAEILSEMKYLHQSRAKSILQMCEKWCVKSQPSSCQYQCIYKICSEDIEWKQNYDRWTEWQTAQIQFNPRFSKQGYK